MAKFSFSHPFRSIGRIVRDLIAGPEQPREQPPEPPQPPQPPGVDYPPFDNYEFDDRRHEIWAEITGEREQSPDAEAGWNVFEDTGAPTGHDYFETNQLWEDFLRAFWLDTDDVGHMLRRDYYDEADISPALINWPDWREWRDTP